MKVFFQAIGLVFTIIVFTLLTISSLYVSYVLTIGIGVALFIYGVYRFLKLLEKVKEDPCKAPPSL